MPYNTRELKRRKMHLTVRIPRFHRIPIFCRADFTPKGERCGRQSGVRCSVYPSQSGYYSPRCYAGKRYLQMPDGGGKQHKYCPGYSAYCRTAGRVGVYRQCFNAEERHEGDSPERKYPEESRRCNALEKPSAFCSRSENDYRANACRGDRDVF